MASGCEVNKCSMCGEVKPVSRKYYHYDINCECCNGDQHFEIVWYCNNCEPKEPKEIRPVLKMKSVD